MTDLVQLTLRAGSGGHGQVSFRREKYVPKGGPDGGDGGDGGSLILCATLAKSSLSHLSGVKTIKAQTGQTGMGKKRAGKKGDDLIIEVPVGTQVWLLAESAQAKWRWQRCGLAPIKRRDVKFSCYQRDWRGLETELDINKEVPIANDWLKPDEAQPIRSTREHGRVLVELLEADQQVLICQGGFGGRGNVHFKSSAQTTPLKAERGTDGEKRRVILELKLLADIGLVGLPSVGKSTLLSVLTPARPKVGAYPFTTLQPNLGIIKGSDLEMVIADVPGLIEGASLGKGLGLDFLRHVEHCRGLVFMLALDEAQVMDESQSPVQKANILIGQYQTLVQELNNYHASLREKEKLIVVNKIDLYPQDLVVAISQVIEQKLNIKPILISAHQHQGLKELLAQLMRFVVKKPKNIMNAILPSIK